MPHLEGILLWQRSGAFPESITSMITMTDLASHDPHPLVGRAQGLRWRPWLVAAAVLTLFQGVAQADDKPVYRCPGNLYTDALSAKEAQDRGCKTLDGAPITVIQSTLPRGNSGAAKPDGLGAKVGAEDQKARDADAKRILEAELKKEEDALAALQKAYNNGQPERQGDERNYQKYQDRVNEMKAALTRKESDVAALRRELAKFAAK
jgi:predicted lipid-binding transport protein (Tim44 family)